MDFFFLLHCVNVAFFFFLRFLIRLVVRPAQNNANNRFLPLQTNLASTNFKFFYKRVCASQYRKGTWPNERSIDILLGNSNRETYIIIAFVMKKCVMNRTKKISHARA